MRYERKEVKMPFGERSIIIETDEERLQFNKLISMACAHYSGQTYGVNSGMYDFVCKIRSGN